MAYRKDACTAERARRKCIVCGRKTQHTENMGGYYGAMGARYFVHLKCKGAVRR